MSAMTCRVPTSKRAVLTAIFLLLASLLLGTRPVDATDTVGNSVPERVSVQIQRTDSAHWLATVTLTNAEIIAAMTLPFRWSGRGILIDSVSYVQTRVEYFALKTFLPDSAAQTILIGLVPDLGMGLPPLEPGEGTILRMYYTGHSSAPATSLRMDTTFIRPHNTLQLVTPDVRSIVPRFEVVAAPSPPVQQ